MPNNNESVTADDVPLEHDVDDFVIPNEVPDLSGPPPGSWADIARMMADGDDSGFDWDAWKDEMKETNGQGY